jgi:hypothetical protein
VPVIAAASTFHNSQENYQFQISQRDRCLHGDDIGHQMSGGFESVRARETMEDNEPPIGLFYWVSRLRSWSRIFWCLLYRVFRQSAAKTRIGESGSWRAIDDSGAALKTHI